jgi:hypothetical protein
MTENQEEVNPDESRRPHWIVDRWTKAWAEATFLRFWPNLAMAAVYAFAAVANGLNPDPLWVAIPFAAYFTYRVAVHVHAAQQYRFWR